MNLRKFFYVVLWLCFVVLIYQIVSHVYWPEKPKSVVIESVSRPIEFVRAENFSLPYYSIRYIGSDYRQQICTEAVDQCSEIASINDPIIFNEDGIIVTVKPFAGPPYVVLGNFNAWLGGPSSEKYGSWKNFFSKKFITETTSDGYPFIPIGTDLYDRLMEPDQLWMVASLKDGEWRGYTSDLAKGYWPRLYPLFMNPNSCYSYTLVTEYSGITFLMTPGIHYSNQICW